MPEVSEAVVSPGRGSVTRGARLYLPGPCGGRGSPEASRCGCVDAGGEPCPARRGRGGGQPPPPGALRGRTLTPRRLMPERPSRAWAWLRGRQVGLAGPGLT